MDSHAWKDGEAEITIQRDTTVFVAGAIDPPTYSIVAELLRVAEENRRLRRALRAVYAASEAGTCPDCGLVGRFASAALRLNDPQGQQETVLDPQPDQQLDVEP